MEVGAAEATGVGRRDADGPEGGNTKAAIKGSVEKVWGEELAPAPVSAGEEAREESRAKKLAASFTADWVEVAWPPADARESDSESRGLKGGTGELDPEGYAFMPSRRVLTCAIRARTSSSGARNCDVEVAYWGE